MTHIRFVGFAGVRATFWVGIFLMVVGAVVTALQPLLVGQIAQSYLSTQEVPRVLLVGLVAVFLADAVGSTSSRLLLGRASERFVLNLREATAARILQARMADITRFDKGDLNNRIIEDIPIVQRPYFSTYPEMVGSGLVALLCFGGLLLTNWQLTLGLLGVMVVAGVLLALVLRNLNVSAGESRTAEAVFSSRLYEVLYNMGPLKALRAERWASDLLGVHARRARDVGNRVVGYSALILPVVNVGTQLGLVGVLLAGGVMVTSGALQPAQLATYFLYLVYMISPLVSLGLALGEIRQADASWERLVALFEGLPPEQDAPGAQTPRLEPPAPLVLTTMGLVYTYGDGTTSENTVDIGDVVIAGPGVRCLVGENGSGKSTLFSLANGLILPSRGEIAWNRVPISEENAQGTREQVHLLPQHRDVMSVSIRDNVTLGAPFTDEEILALAARLGAQRFFAEMPAGLDTRVGAEGTGLSGGQKQLLFVMHALLKRPPVLLLDEFAANLDAGTKERVADALDDLGRTSLVVLIAHDDYLLRRFPDHIRLAADRTVTAGVGDA